MSSNGIERIAIERLRQVESEGWTPEHDDEHTGNELVWAAIAYAAPTIVLRCEVGASGIPAIIDPFPQSWLEGWDKRERLQSGYLCHAGHAIPTERYIRRLEKAGALIAAEIDRLLRRESEQNANALG